MQEKLFTAYSLGVLNITPNSFSDGNQWKDQSELLFRFNQFLKLERCILDLGAESTAPMNHAITIEEEMERFESFFSLLEGHPLLLQSFLNLGKIFISIDTYRFETFLFVQKKCRDLYQKSNEQCTSRFIWNDISGLQHPNLIDYLKANPLDLYIYSATLIESESAIFNHGQILFDQQNGLYLIEEKFKTIDELFSKHQISDQLILDFAFGFNKDSAFNWKILKSYLLDGGLEHLSSTIKTKQFLIGISKKRFLQSVIDPSLSLNAKSDSELIHFYLLCEILKKYPSLNIRLHDPRLVKWARDLTGQLLF